MGERRSDDRLRAAFAQLLEMQETDRQRFAVELHSGIGQIMSLVKVTLDAAADQIHSGAADKAEKSIRWLIPIVVDTLADLRRISSELRPSILDDLGLKATLTWFFRRLESSHPEIKLERVVSVDEANVPAALRITLFRILQESITLMLKSEHTKELHIQLDQKHASLHLAVSSCCTGCHPHVERKRKHESLEMLSIRERALLYGARCKICVCQSGGMMIEVSWSAQALAKFAAKDVDERRVAEQ
jgi:signal transduction histidine kinase